jgi:secondary thiamine-phosphate synthase enzyme
MRESAFQVHTKSREEILLITDQVQDAITKLTSDAGICTIIVPHTTCAVSVNENADPDVPADLTRALRALVPNVPFRHGEGNSDAHLLSMLIGTSLSWPYRDGRLLLGTWQGIYFIELDGPRTRKVTVYV